MFNLSLKIISEAENLDLEIYGSELAQAEIAVILLHGRRQESLDIYKNIQGINLNKVSYILPIAKNKTWYPHSFMASIESNQPFLQNSLNCIQLTIDLLHKHGFNNQQIILMGFSQGACLASEYVYKNPNKWGGLIVFSGGLFGPAGTTWNPTSLIDVPIFIGTSDCDSWIPLERVQETEKFFIDCGAKVDLRIYPNMPHHICDDEIIVARSILVNLLEKTSLLQELV